MGCGASASFAEVVKTASRLLDPPESEGTKEVRLLDEYTLGVVLGQGAFGIVYECTKKATNESMAVKMVDKAQSPLSDIRRECEMLQKLNHPSVVKLHDVFYEKVFVCIVLDLLKGGDMIVGMQTHWKDKGKIPSDIIQNLSKQMLHSIQWLHSQSIMHRDLKGDNFLQDRKELGDKKCRVFLGDFGTVIGCKETQRLSQRIGTKRYWAPEFFDNDYGQKADVWALGVVIYGLVFAQFPFKPDETEIKTKQLTFQRKCSKECQDFIKGMLERYEDKRFTAEHSLGCLFMSSVKAADCEDLQALDPDFKPDIKEGGANVAVAERRQELIARLQEAQQTKITGRSSAARCTQTIADFTNGFDVYYPETKSTHKFDWWPQDKVRQNNLVDSTARAYIEEDSKTDREYEVLAINKSLAEHGISLDKFGVGEAKTIQEFCAELRSGASRLMLDAASYKNIVRVVDVVIVRIHCEEGGIKKVLAQTSEQYPDGRNIQKSQLPGVTKLPHENAVQAAQRMVVDILGMQDCEIDFNFMSIEQFENEETSASYPGVRTVYRKAILEGVPKGDVGGLRVGTVSGRGQFKWTDTSKYTRSFSWLTEEQLDAQKIVHRAPKEDSDLSSLVYPPIGFEEEELCQFLMDCNVDVSQFGEGTNASLELFSGELLKGEAVLQKQPDGKVTRVVDVVILEITREDGRILVEETQTVTGATSITKTLNRLPAVKRRSDENHFLAAKRVVNKILHLDENSVNIVPNGVRVCEAETMSVAYCGIPTKYQKRYITGSLVAEAN